MNDPMLLIDRLRDLIDLAKASESGFEKASVYAATKEIYRSFSEQENKFDIYAMEKILEVAWHINAVVGYDITNGHSSEQHIVWAIGQLNSLKSQIEET